ncbi:CoA-binding protein [candidate division KSB1 bacterium]|nr:CoA-binding protein [candidate division KSB1 bacterium]
MIPYEDFWSMDKKYAVVGASRDRKKFGNLVYRMAKERGFTVWPVNPNAGEVEGDPCYSSLKDLPQPVDGVVLVVPPEVSRKVAEECLNLGVKNLWFQPGSASEEVLVWCREKGLNTYSRRCALLYLKPIKFPHSLHAWILKLFGKY